MKHKAYCLQKIGLRRGNVYENLDTKIFDWLIDETVKVKADNLGLTIASILKDACYQEQGEER